MNPENIQLTFQVERLEFEVRPDVLHHEKIDHLVYFLFGSNKRKFGIIRPMSLTKFI